MAREAGAQRHALEPYPVVQMFKESVEDFKESVLRQTNTSAAAAVPRDYKRGETRPCNPPAYGDVTRVRPKPDKTPQRGLVQRRTPEVSTLR